jgi:hypothetical protein
MILHNLPKRMIPAIFAGLFANELTILQKQNRLILF